MGVSDGSRVWFSVSGGFCGDGGLREEREGGGGEERAREAYGPSVQVKTWEKPQDRTWASDSLREGGEVIIVEYRSGGKEGL